MKTSKNLIAMMALCFCASFSYAQNGDENRLKALVRSFYNTSIKVLSGENASTALSADANAADITEGSKKELDNNGRLQANLAARQISYVNGQLKNIVYEDIRVSGNTATVKAKGLINFRYKAGPGAPEFTEYEEAYTFVFDKTGNRWVLRSTEARPYGDVINTTPPNAQVNKDTLPKANKAPTKIEGGSPADRPKEFSANQGNGSKGPWINNEPSGLFYGTFNWDAAAAYARKWARSYNPDYTQFTNDCTNFISQCLRAGGWIYVGSEFSRTSNTTWYYGYLSQSYTWAGAHNHWAFHASMSRSWVAEQMSWLYVGEPISIDFTGDGHIDHTVLVTTKDASNNLYVSYHTNNNLDRPMTYFYTNYPNAKYYGWMMKGTYDQ
jgi:hypothetical protein